MIINRLHQHIVFLFIILCSALSLNAKEYEVKDVPNVHVADRTRFLSNPDGLISLQAQTIADSIMSDVWNKTSAEVTAVAIESIGDKDANQFATDLFEEWKIGKKDRDNGVLILIVNDTHDIVIRTGYGAEGPLPDITAGRIIRDYMIPAIRQNGLNAGLLAGVQMTHDVLTDPAVADELKSSIANNAGAGKEDESFSDLLSDIIKWGVFLAIAMLFLVLITSIVSKKKPFARRYQMIDNLTIYTLAATFFGVGIPVIAWLIARKMRNNLRHTAPDCDICNSKMREIPQNEVASYLSPQQSTESRIGSVNHIVWQCPKGCQTRTRSYPGPTYQKYSVCDNCGARAVHLNRSYTTRQPSQFHAGERMDEYVCEHCGKITRKPRSIAKLIPPIIIGGFGGGRGMGGGGGFSGGSFGGGSTGGGGASGRW